MVAKAPWLQQQGERGAVVMRQTVGLSIEGRWLDPTRLHFETWAFLYTSHHLPVNGLCDVTLTTLLNFAIVIALGVGRQGSVKVNVTQLPACGMRLTRASADSVVLASLLMV